MMYKSNRQLKQEAKQALSGKWGIAVLMSLLTVIITYSFNVGNVESIAFTITSLISSVLSIILNVGFLSFFLKICCGQKESANFSDLFYGFQCHPGKAILLYLLNVLYLLPGTFIYAILLVVLMFVTFANISYTDLLSADISPTQAVVFIIAFLVLIILYIIYACYIQLTYGMVYYLLLDYPDLPVNQIWKRSAQLMKGNRWRKFKLELSFIPWMIACIFTLFIGYLWLGAYMNATFTEFYLDLVQQQACKNQTTLSGIDQDTFQ